MAIYDQQLLYDSSNINTEFLETVPKISGIVEAKFAVSMAGDSKISGVVSSFATGYPSITLDGSSSMIGTGSVDVSGFKVGNTFTSMNGSADMSITPKIYLEVSVSLSASLSSNVEYQLLKNSYVTMYGFLNSNVSTYSSIICSDLKILFVEQMIESTGCTIGEESVELTRYRGDTYPVSTTLSKNGSTDVTGSTFKMSTQINDGTIYTVDGVIENALMGLVSFPLDTNATSVSGVGVYDIQGNDGTYIYTYDKGVFTLLDDVTV